MSYLYIGIKLYFVLRNVMFPVTSIIYKHIVLDPFHRNRKIQILAYYDKIDLINLFFRNPVCPNFSF